MPINIFTNCNQCGKKITDLPFTTKAGRFTVCIECASKEERSLENELISSLSEEQKIIFEKYKKIVDYRHSYWMLAT